VIKIFRQDHCFLSLLFGFSFLVLTQTQSMALPQYSVANYNLAWSGPSAGAKGSMPFADDMLAKLGKLTLNFDPADFGSDVQQILKLEQGGTR